MEQILFYTLAAVTVIATILAVAERHPVHAIVYLVTSFFSLAVIFFLLAAPLIAVFEVIIYAGAVMVLFMFVVMMLDLGGPAQLPTLGRVLPALLLAGITLVSLGLLIVSRGMEGQGGGGLQLTSVRDFAVTLFTRYGVAIEIISMQLLFAIVAALYLGRRRRS